MLTIVIILIVCVNLIDLKGVSIGVSLLLHPNDVSLPAGVTLVKRLVSISLGWGSILHGSSQLLSSALSFSSMDSPLSTVPFGTYVNE